MPYCNETLADSEIHRFINFEFRNNRFRFRTALTILLVVR